MTALAARLVVAVGVLLHLGSAGGAERVRTPPEPWVGEAATAASRARALTREPASEAVTDVPVLLVPGWLDTDRELAALRIRLMSAGWDPAWVAAVGFRDPTGSNGAHAEELARAADSLLERTGAARLDVVAHSMGGLATRVWLRNGGARVARRVVFVASPHRGTWSAYLAWGDGSEEMRPGSSFLDSLNVGPPVPDGVRALTIRTTLDAHILPPESATLPGVPDVEVCCPTHTGLLRDIEVFRIIRRFLDEGEVGDGDGAPP